MPAQQFDQDLVTYEQFQLDNNMAMRRYIFPNDKFINYDDVSSKMITINDDNSLNYHHLFPPFSPSYSRSLKNAQSLSYDYQLSIPEYSDSQICQNEHDNSSTICDADVSNDKNEKDIPDEYETGVSDGYCINPAQLVGEEGLGTLFLEYPLKDGRRHTVPIPNF